MKAQESRSKGKKFAMRKKLVWLLGVVAFAMIVIIGINSTRSYKSQFKGPVSADEPLPEALTIDLEKYVMRLMKQFDVPGVSMVLVKGDRIVYARGLGVRDLKTKEPVGTDTLMGIASTTKPMTAVMIASLVDEGVIAWDTPVTEILPSFAVPDPEITEKITFEHTLCMCTGVPKRLEAISVQYNELTAENIIESLATIPLVGRFEHTFGYSSRMLSAGGYLAAMAAGGEYGQLAPAYAREMQERVFDPVGMTSSTFSIEEVIASGNYATPYYSYISGYKAIPLEIEGLYQPIAPAGALWSTADDLGKFLIMALNNGVSDDGQRVVSAENLHYLWVPHVNQDAHYNYGLGWDLEYYSGLNVIQHPGGSVGFASELVVIPELDIGFALLTNRLDLVAQLGRMTTYRLLEMLTGSEQVYDQGVRRSVRDARWQIFTLSLVTRKTVDPDKIAPFLDSYHNDALGEVKLVLHDDHTLWIDFGEYESAIRPLVIEENQYIFIESAFIGKTIQLGMNTNGVLTMKWSGDEDSYNFVAMSSPE